MAELKKNDAKLADKITDERAKELEKKSTIEGEEEMGDDIPMTFPQKLMEILNKPENNDIISWLLHGKGFIIFKKKKFAADILPKFFKQAKFTSFTRKLNRWGFTRVTRGPETGAYYHKFFVRDEPRLCMQMSCQNIRHYQEQLAIEQQQRQRQEAALAAVAGQFNPAFAAPRMGPPFGFGGLVQPGQLPDMNMLQQQAAMQQLQIDQLQQQQQLQASELVRRAMATQATASATQAHLAAMTTALGDSANKGTEQQQQQQRSAAGDAAPMPSPSDLYMQLLQSKASQMTARPLMAAIQNSLRTAPADALARASAMSANNAEAPAADGNGGKRTVRRASAA